MTYTKKGHLSSQITSDGIILLDKKTGNIHHLNPIAALIWENIDNPTDVISKIIIESYEIDQNTAINDINTTVDELCQRGLIKKS